MRSLVMTQPSTLYWMAKSQRFLLVVKTIESIPQSTLFAELLGGQHMFGWHMTCPQMGKKSMIIKDEWIQEGCADAERDHLEALHKQKI